MYQNFIFFTQIDHSEVIHGIVRQGAPLHLVDMGHDYYTEVTLP
jgi:hypothetical protein